MKRNSLYALITIFVFINFFCLTLFADSAPKDHATRPKPLSKTSDCCSSQDRWNDTNLTLLYYKQLDAAELSLNMPLQATSHHRVNFEMAPTEFSSPDVSDIPEPGFPPHHSNIYDPPSAGTL